MAVACKEEEEPEAETESQRARGMPRIWGARVEPRALATEAEIRRSAAEPELLRTKVELAGGRSPTEPEGRSDEVQPEERSPEAMAGRCPTKAEPEGTMEPGGAGGSTGDGGGEGARSRGGAAGSTGRGGVRASEVGGGGEGYSDHGDAGGWQSRGARTVLMVGWGRAEGLTDDSGGGGRSGWEGGHLWASRLSGLNSGSRARSSLDKGTRALSGQDVRTAAHSGRDMGTGVTKGSEEGGSRGSRSASRSFRSFSASPLPRFILSSLLATGAGGGAALHAHTIRGFLPRDGRCSRQLIGRVGLYFRGNPPLSRSALRWLFDCGGNCLSVLGGLELALKEAERWWAGHWVWSGSISHQNPLHKGGEICSRTIFGRWHSARGVQACVNPASTFMSGLYDLILVVWVHLRSLVFSL